MEVVLGGIWGDSVQVSREKFDGGAVHASRGWRGAG